MDPILQASNLATVTAAGNSQSASVSGTNDPMLDQMIEQGAQQVFGILFSLIMSQTGEG
ncbi:hypothetical protein [Rhabdaerophilum sp. SD176]|uniref:hypothetical protein n=1 Tax=Rhabdaerophilum sp. SD176 TaxID=2983548 RepID=UPI0024DFB707|nr:hypothetical protein [Rhabdaerophilum sp. SD176]